MMDSIQRRLEIGRLFKPLLSMEMPALDDSGCNRQDFLIRWVLLVIRVVHSASDVWISTFMNVVNGASSIASISDNGGAWIELIRGFGCSSNPQSSSKSRRQHSATKQNHLARQIGRQANKHLLY